MQAVKNNKIGVKNISGKKINFTNDSEKDSFVEKVMNYIKSLFNSNTKIEVSTMEDSKEIRNFNKKVNVHREEINANIRMLSFMR